jgi:thiol-disulfide isomerase/thioredoxin
MFFLNLFERLSRYSLDRGIGKVATAGVWSDEKCHPMARELKDGQLSGVIRSAEKKLVGVDFWNVNCAPCRAARPWWDSLQAKYPTTIFCAVQCALCPNDASAQNIRATPTFLFFYNGAEVGRIQGAEQSQIIAIIEKYRGPPAFHGSGRSLGAPSPPKPAADSRAPVSDAWTRAILLDMGFPAAKVDAAVSITNHGTVDECVVYLERIQEIGTPNKTMQALLDMGYDASVARAAIAKVGNSSVETCVRAIEEMAATAEEPQQPPPAGAASARENAAQAKPGDPAQTPSTEFARRREQVEARDRLRQIKADHEEQMAKAQRAEDVKARQQVLQKMNEDRKKPPPATAGESHAHDEPPRAPSGPVAGECTLKLVFEGAPPPGNSIIQKFQAQDTLGKVCEFVRANVAAAARKKIAFETLVPKQRLGNETFGQSLSSLGLAPRAQLFVKYL